MKNVFEELLHYKIVTDKTPIGAALSVKYMPAPINENETQSSTSWYESILMTRELDIDTIGELAKELHNCARYVANEVPEIAQMNPIFIDEKGCGNHEFPCGYGLKINQMIYDVKLLWLKLKHVDGVKCRIGHDVIDYIGSIVRALELLQLALDL